MRRLLGIALASLWIVLPLPPGGRLQAAPAADGATPTPAGKGEGRKKKGHDNTAVSPSPAATKGGGMIQIPLPPGKTGADLHVPEMDTTGKLMSLLKAQKATRLDDERVKMEAMHMDFNKPDGKQDFHIDMPVCILNLKTHIVTSDDPVTVQTQDFELTGEKLEFNTLEREGSLIGKVRMVIHNLKQLAGPQEDGEQSK